MFRSGCYTYLSSDLNLSCDNFAMTELTCDRHQIWVHAAMKQLSDWWICCQFCIWTILDCLSWPSVASLYTKHLDEQDLICKPHRDRREGPSDSRLDGLWSRNFLYHTIGHLEGSLWFSGQMVEGECCYHDQFLFHVLWIRHIPRRHDFFSCNFPHLFVYFLAHHGNQAAWRWNTKWYLKKRCAVSSPICLVSHSFSSISSSITWATFLRFPMPFAEVRDVLIPALFLLSKLLGVHQTVRIAKFFLFSIDWSVESCQWIRFVFTASGLSDVK